MSQEFRLSIKNFSQRKIVNVKDIFKNLTEAEKEILEREKRRAEEKVFKAKNIELINELNRQKQRVKHASNKQPSQTSIRKSKFEDKKSFIANPEVSKSSIQFQVKVNEMNTNRASKPNRYKVVNYDEAMNTNNLIYTYSNESNEDKATYEENFKRYISHIDLNLNRILNEKKMNKSDFELINKITMKKPQKPSKMDMHKNEHDHLSGVFRRQSNDENEDKLWDNDEKLNKFNGFKKKIKNLFASDERIDSLGTKKFDDNNRPVRIIKLKESKYNDNNTQHSNDKLDEPYYLDSNKKWNNYNNYNKNFKYKSPKTNDIIFMSQNRYNSSPSTETFTTQNDTKFRKLSNLINRTKNFLH